MLKRTVVEVHPKNYGAGVPLEKPLYDPDVNVIPDWFDPRKLTGLLLTGATWFDKKRPGVHVGSEKKQ